MLSVILKTEIIIFHSKDLLSYAVRFSEGGVMKKKSGGSRREKRQVHAERKGFRINRKYKDSLFRMIFNSRNALLSLYNAINRSDYMDPEELEITTIKDVIYIGVKNDVSFLIDDFMSLYEAQSSDNPNMPLRGLIYFAQLYQSYVAGHGLNIYSGNTQRIPTPRYVVLYNGTASMPDVSEYRLSDAFEHPQETCCLECVATVLNINAGHNQELMDSCRLLYEYAHFVECIRHYLEQYEGELEYAVDCAVDDCIRTGILKTFLIKHRAEVKSVILTEYDARQHMEAEKSESYREGESRGESRFAALSLKLLSTGKTEDLELAARDESMRRELYRKYGI